MLKHFVLLLVLCIIAAFFIQYLGVITQLLHSGYLEVHKLFSGLLKSTPGHRYTPTIFALFLIPTVIGAIPSLLYWMFKQKAMPNTMTVIWSVWLVLLILVASN